MKHSEKNFLSTGELKYTVETRESGEVVVFTQDISLPNSQPSELAGVINVISSGSSSRSRKYTTMKDNITLDEIKDCNIVQIISNRPIGTSISSKGFQRQVEFQQMAIKGEPITNSRGEQLYHLFALSYDAKDVSLDYAVDEKTEELAKANQILGIASLDTTVAEETTTDTF